MVFSQEAEEYVMEQDVQILTFFAVWHYCFINYSVMGECLIETLTRDFQTLYSTYRSVHFLCEISTSFFFSEFE